MSNLCKFLVNSESVVEFGVDACVDLAVEVAQAASAFISVTPLAVNNFVGEVIDALPAGSGLGADAGAGVAWPFIWSNQY